MLSCGGTEVELASPGFLSPHSIGHATSASPQFFCSRHKFSAILVPTVRTAKWKTYFQLHRLEIDFSYKYSYNAVFKMSWLQSLRTVDKVGFACPSQLCYYSDFKQDLSLIVFWKLTDKTVSVSLRTLNISHIPQHVELVCQNVARK